MKTLSQPCRLSGLQLNATLTVRCISSSSNILYHPPHTYLPASFAWDFEAPETVASATAKMHYPPPPLFALFLLSTPYHLSGRLACPNSGVTSPDQQNGAQSYDRSANCCACFSKIFFVGQNCRF